MKQQGLVAVAIPLNSSLLNNAYCYVLHSTSLQYIWVPKRLRKVKSSLFVHVFIYCSLKQFMFLVFF